MNAKYVYVLRRHTRHVRVVTERLPRYEDVFRILRRNRNVKCILALDSEHVTMRCRGGMLGVLAYMLADALQGPSEPVYSAGLVEPKILANYVNIAVTRPYPYPGEGNLALLVFQWPDDQTIVALVETSRLEEEYKAGSLEE